MPGPGPNWGNIMRCKKHLADLSSGVGICATCLRERLFAVMAAQAQKEAQLHQAQLDCRKSDTQLRPAFPRSVSPYVSRRKSTNSAATLRVHGHGCDTRFYSTPQVGGNGSVAVEKKKKKSNGGRFSKMFMGIFRSKSGKREADSVPGSVSGISSEYSCTGSPSWFSTMIPGSRRKQNRTFSLDEGAIAAHRRAYRNGERGMSPVRYSDHDDDPKHCHVGSSGYSSESSQGRKYTPRMTPAHRGGVMRGTSHSRNVSGLAFCLSPLVRASPNHHWNQIGAPAPEMAMVGETRAHPHSHLSSTTPAMYKNRSRKLADFGRHSYNSLH